MRRAPRLSVVAPFSVSSLTHRTTHDHTQALITQILDNIVHLASNKHMFPGTKECKRAAAAACGYVGKKAVHNVKRDANKKKTYLALQDITVVDVRSMPLPAPDSSRSSAH